jgi:folate-binding protein YgfZ
LNKVFPGDWDQYMELVSSVIPGVMGNTEGTIRSIQGEQIEYDALGYSTGLVVCPLVVPVLIEGEDALDYLHRRLSQSIRDLEPGKGAHALQLDALGRIQADMLVYRGQDALFSLLGVDHAQAAADQMEQFVLMDRVEISRQWNSEWMIGLAGPGSTRIINGLIEPLPPGGQLDPGHYDAVFTVNLAGVPCRIFGDGRWDMPFFHISVSGMCIHHLLQELFGYVQECGGSAVGMNALEHVRIETGIPMIGKELDEQTNALDAGLYDAVHFDKGCYPGQEVMAKINNLGHPARHLVRLEADEEADLAAGLPLAADGREVGNLTSSSTWPGLGKTAALGYLKWESRNLNTVVIDDGVSKINARVLSMDRFC